MRKFESSKNIFMRILVFLFLNFFILTLHAQKSNRLYFNEANEFKIVQFTDLHIELDRKKFLEVYETIPAILEIEKPDLVVITGDVVTENDPQRAFKKLSDIFVEYKVPYAIVFGNHDSEYNLSRKQVAKYIETLPGILNKNDKRSEGYTNFVLPIYGKGDQKKAILYFMDSNENSTMESLDEGWGWFTHNQVSWYRKQSRKYTKENKGVPYPALAFFHIPLPEYERLWDDKNNIPIGTRNDYYGGPLINTGMFAAMIEGGDVMGTFVGHDHYNDYIGVHLGIALAYGRVTKTGHYELDPGPGARVIVIKEGKRSFDTWIREPNGNQLDMTNFPDSFLPKEE